MDELERIFMKNAPVKKLTPEMAKKIRLKVLSK